ncbi:hypothetical protein DWX43_07515 [Clostridium sp. AF19-22AC]|jgi:hypothetical protein|uniref:hypothetical protein n=1 Tax=Clostridia TaxID=186801 RepID=UPI000E481931|nr:MULTISPECIES: hypothetical protein [Clostridia]RHR30698.1 hypothetical protein DWX43_07515 [Clostridium sp. AF19-22AC]
MSVQKGQKNKRRLNRICLTSCLMAALGLLSGFTALAADEEKSLSVSLQVDSSYTVTIPKAVTIYPSMDFRVDGELGGTAEGGVAAITAATNTEPGYTVRVRVKADSFNGAGGISLVSKSDSTQVLTTMLSVRNTTSDEFIALKKDNNVAAEFYGLTGTSNAKVAGGSIHFSAPDEAQQSGEYEGKMIFEISYEKEKP